MDVTKLLKEDHDRVRELFRKFRGGGGISGLVKRVTGSVTPRERRSAVERVCRELDVHARLEEEIFYPAVRALGDAELNRLIEESLREHAQVKEQIAGLRGARADAPDLDDRVGNLEQCVEHHASEEENEMFPRLQNLMPEAERETLGRRIQARKRSAAPSGPRRATTGTAGRPRKARPATGGAQRTAATATRRRVRPAAKVAARKKVKRAKRARGSRGR